jgi:hypothetical protein
MGASQVHALSFEQAPPPSAPLRFFLSAPLFILIAALVLLIDGEQVFMSRWTPAALALTHLFTVGFMLQVMLGALFQLMPVAAGANLWRPAMLATTVHLATVSGALLLVAGFLFGHGAALIVGGGILLLGLVVFITSATIALWRTPARGPTVTALRWAVGWLCLTVLLGFGMVLARAGWADLFLLRASPLHVVGGLAGWGGVLVAGTAYLVVPMFQLTPAYPAWFSRGFAWALAAAIGAGMAIDDPSGWVPLLVVVAGFAAMTLDRQRRRRRARGDVTLRLWQLAMACVIGASVLCIAHLAGSMFLSGATLVGVLVVWGGFVSLIAGMLYKIVPFILWLHLQPRLSKVPPMTRMLSEPLIRWHLRLHVATLLAAIIAVFLPSMGPLAGALMLFAGVLLYAQLVGVVRQARRALRAALQPS